MEAYFRHFFEALLNPLMFFFFALLGLYWAIGRYESKCIQRYFIGVLLFLSVLSTGWMPRFIVRQIEGAYSPVTRIMPNVKWVVVLGGGSVRGEMPSNILLNAASLNRLVEGIRIYRQIPGARLLLSGGGFDPDYSEAFHLKEAALFLGVPKEHLFLEEASMNTQDEMRELKKILKKESFYLVTSAFHMPRALMYAHQYGLNPIPAPTDYTLYWEDERWEKLYFPQPKNLLILSVVWREGLGIAWGKLMHLTSTLTVTIK